MKNIDIARAWKDAEYRDSLSAEELATLPANPAGTFELSENELLQALGAGPPPTSACSSSCDTRYCTVCSTATSCHTSNMCSEYTYPNNSQCTNRKPNVCWD